MNEAGVTNVMNTEVESIIERSTGPQPRERRRHGRAPCVGFAEVVLDGAAFLFRGSIRDLSHSGCYIKSRARLLLARGTTVELRLSVKGQALQLGARLMIVRPGAGAGFEFLSVGPEMQSRLSSLFDELGAPYGGNATAVAGNAARCDHAGACSRDL